MTMDKRIIPLIMCGGAGTRLWPASREVRPKRFLPLFGTRSTSQDTLLRVSALLTAAPEIQELDLNPVIVLRSGVRVADVRVRIDLVLEEHKGRRVDY